MKMVYAVIRVRGLVNVNGKVQDTLRMLRLTRPNHAALVPSNDPSTDGMLAKVKDMVTYGEVDAETLALLLKGRGRAIGEKPLTDAWVKEKTGGKHATIDAFAKALASDQARLRDLGEDAKLFFRLHPPVGGWERIKLHHTVGGALGYRGKEINPLLRKMLPGAIEARDAKRAAKLAPAKEA